MENFPVKKEGDNLGAEHVNWLTAGMKAMQANFPNGSLPPFSLQYFEVVEEACDGNAALYRIVPRYWDNEANRWVTDESNENQGVCLDAVDTGQTYQIGDKVQAYYDAQRGTYIPLAASSTTTTPPTTDSGCACTCIDEGDIEVQGIITTSVWSVTVPAVRFEQTHGTITLPAGTYIITYNTGTGTWVLDVGDDLVAVYNDGSDATVDTTMDGTLSMSWGGSVAEINICVDGTISDPNEESSSTS